MSISNYYQTLEVNKEASVKDIASAYIIQSHRFRRLSLKWHPKLSNADPNTAYSNFCKVSEAYEVLSDGNDVIIKMKEE